jgi:hypothetical protein
MHVTKRRILEFAQQHDRLPSTLAELPLKPDHNNDTTDAWKRPLDYSVSSSGIVTLQSLGKDKLPGGGGDSRDMIGVFASRDSQGNWQQQNLIEWIKDPRRP